MNTRTFMQQKLEERNGHVPTPAHTEAVTPSRKHAGRRVLALAALAVVTLTGALVAGTLPRLRQIQELDTAAAETITRPSRVTVATARQAAADHERVLPGNALPLLEAAIFARTTGYVKRRLVDIGDRVQEGQLLAEIATPEIDAQLEQARATLLQDKANLIRNKADETFAHSEENRYRRLVRTGGASVEDYENKRTMAHAATATVRATEAAIKVDEANIVRLSALQSFERVTAPFAGVITARHVDPGDLISADSPNSTREMFHLMRTDILRVFVDVPQVFATAIKTGQYASVYRREEPSRPFQGQVTRTANSLDLATRTLRTEVQVPNPDNALRPGMYLQVKFLFNREASPILIPSAAVVTRADGPKVGVMDNRMKVHYRQVQLGRDYGAEVEVLAGLTAGDTIVVRPGDDLPEGTVVDPVHQQPVAR
ncbi:MAG TPA: efflux RND transporter periplasmic adaptor subunit [Gemmataceae bacterium]|nr:efflux RND transporter periplasmic adaptor subunit [Gemmataceae bacterium]